MMNTPETTMQAQALDTAAPAPIADTEAQEPAAVAHGAPVEALTVDCVEGAALLGIGRTTFYKLHLSGRLPLPIRFGRSVRWRRAELSDWLAAGCPPREKWNWKKM